MPRDEPLRFYVDETSMALGRALAAVRGDVVFPGHRRLPEVVPGTYDRDWLPVIGRMDLVVISRDRHIKSKPAELEAYRAHGIRAFWIAGDKDLSSWENLTRVVRWWPEIERVIKRRGAGPWFQAIHATKVAEILIRGTPAPKLTSAGSSKPQTVDRRGQLRLPWSK